mmetsp:Transcript_68380/g.117436  ORF Transcript_68380/g.117436 Transcript_68380/m.117436 type:complete len:418 (+) Transcript_68380:33-1286(+)
MLAGSIALFAIFHQVVEASVQMTVVHPSNNPSALKPFHWDRSHLYLPADSSITSSEVAQSVLRLMGAPPVSASAARNLPSPDVLSPPRITVVVAIGGTDADAIALSMPKLRALMEGQTTASVTHDKRAERGVLGFTFDRVFHGIASLGTTAPYTACVSAVEAVQSSELCRSASDSVRWQPFSSSSSSAAGGGFAEASSLRAPPGAWSSAELPDGGEAALGNLLAQLPSSGDATLNEAADAFLFSELRLLAVLGNALRPPSLHGGGASPLSDLVVLTLSSAVGMLDAYGATSPKRLAALGLLDSALSQALLDLSSAGGAVAAQLLLVEDFEQDSKPFVATGKRRRSLLATDDDAAGLTDDGSEALTLSQITSYQISLWTGIVLFLILLSAICCMINMDIQPDSLLYAKFQADVSSKLE